MFNQGPPLPFTCLVHADWSTRAAGRWRAAASRNGGNWRVSASQPVGDPSELIASLRASTAGGGALLGVDLPIGAPRAWAERAGMVRFIDALAEFGGDDWPDMLNPAVAPEDVSPRRPFYPMRPGGARQAHLVDGVGVPHMHALRRRCDFDADGKPAATPLFWTLGAAQVGKAAIAFWRDVLQPALQADDVVVWPFQGDLAGMAAPGRVVVAETYPAEAYGWFDLEIRLPGRSKRRREDRAADGPRLLAAGRAMDAEFDEAAVADIVAGFPEGGDDAFDATVGLLAMIAVVNGARAEGVPDDPAVRSIEGWILGRRAGPARSG